MRFGCGALMAGSVVTVGVVALGVSLALGVAVAGGAAIRQAQVSGIADAAALAAADAVSGFIAGVPCERAAQVVSAAPGARLTSCSLEGMDAVIEVRTTFGAFEVPARARAGPPRDAGAEVAG